MRTTLATLYGFATFSLLVSASPLARLTSRDARDIVGWTYTGCFAEATGHRSLSGATIVDAAMSVGRCAIFCAHAGFPVFGVEYGVECFCGPSLTFDTFPAPPGECNFPCPGKPSETCGAGNRLNVYNRQDDPLASTTTTTTTTTSSPSPLPTSHTFQGCYSEATVGRALTGKYVTSDTLTVESCAASCAGYAYFGLEYWFECFCGNELQEGSIQVGGAECNYPCRGDDSQTCGASYRLSMYSFGDSVPQPSVPSATTTTPPASTSTPLSGVTALGCYTDKTYSRALKGATYFDDSMTVEKCSVACSEYDYFGVEYGRECFCGDVLEGSEEVLIEQCNMPCSGNNAQICGAGDRLNVYQYACVSSSSSTTVSSTLGSTSVLTGSTTSYVTAASTTSSSEISTTTTTTTAPPVSTAIQCTVKSTLPANSVCGANGWLNYLYTQNILETIYSTRVEDPIITNEDCAILCFQNANCQSIIYQARSSNMPGSGYCQLVYGQHPSTGFFPTEITPVVGWNLDCFECAAPPTASTTSSSEISTTTTMTSTTSVPSVPTATQCAVKSTLPEDSVCGAHSELYYLSAHFIMDSIVSTETETPEGCALACSERANCVSILHSAPDPNLIGSGFCQFMSGLQQMIDWTMGPSYHPTSWNLDCFECVALPTASTTTTTTELTTSSTTSEPPSTSTTSDSATTSTTTPASPTGSCTAKSLLPENSICGVYGYIAFTAPGQGLESTIMPDVTASTCAQACSDTPSCVSFFIDEDQDYCLLFAVPLEVVFQANTFSTYQNWDLNCFTCGAPSTASTTSSSTSDMSSTSTTTASSTSSTTSEVSSTTSAPASPTVPCTARTPLPENSVCGVKGAITSTDSSQYLNTFYAPEYLTAQGCSQACSDTVSCAAFRLNENYCQVYSASLEALIFVPNPAAYYSHWDIDCFVCGAPSTTSTTSSSSATSETSSTSTTSEVSSTTSAPASTGCTVPETAICGVYGSTSTTDQSHLPVILYDSQYLTVSGCTQACVDRIGCASFGLEEGRMCLLYTVPLVTVNFVPIADTGFLYSDISCTTCNAPSTVSTTTSTSTSTTTASSTSSTTSEASSTTSSIGASPTPTAAHCTVLSPLPAPSVCGRFGTIAAEDEYYISRLTGSEYFNPEGCALACFEKSGCQSFNLWFDESLGRGLCELQSASQELAGFVPDPYSDRIGWNIGCFECLPAFEPSVSATSSSTTTTAEASTSSSTTSEATSTTSESSSSTTSEPTTTSTSAEPTTTSTTSSTVSTIITTTLITSTTTTSTSTSTTTTTVSATPSPGPNMLQNPGFESGDQYWQYNGMNEVPGTVAGKASDVLVKTGTQSWRVYQDSPVRDTRQTTIKQSNFATPIGSKYRVMIWANRISGNCALNINLQEQVVLSRSGSIATGWVEMTGYVTATRETSAFTVRVTCSYIGIQEYVVDDVRLQRIYMV